MMGWIKRQQQYFITNGQVDLRHIPNIITILRLLLVMPIVFYLTQKAYHIALVLFVIAAGSDGLDGLLARHFHWTSKFGSIVDPIADKLLMMSVFFILTWQARIPWWVLILIIAREIIIVGGACLYRVFISDFQATPSLISKCNTVVQIILATLILWEFNFQSVNANLINGGIYLLAFTTFVSLAHYMWVWGKRTAHELSKQGK